MKSFLIAAVLAFFSTFAHPQIVGVHIGSYHAPAYDYNNLNLGYYVIEKNGFTYGTYRNSERTDSAYLGHTFQGRRFDFLVGGVAGYPKKQLMLMFVPSMKLRIAQDQTLRVAAMPLLKNHKLGAVVHVMYEWKLK